MLYLIGVIISFFLAFLLLVKKNKNIADKILFFWLLVIGFHLFMAYLFFIEKYKDYIDNLPMDKMNSLSNIFGEKILDCINFHNVMNHNIELQNKYNKLLGKENSLLDAFKVYDRLIPWINVMFYDDEKNYNSILPYRY